MEITIKVDGVTVTARVTASDRQMRAPADAHTLAVAQLPEPSYVNPHLKRVPFMTADMLRERQEAEWRERQRREGLE